VIDFLILADSAEAVNGKLYMLGGAFDRFFVADFSNPVSFCLALGVLVPWTATNQPHTVEVTLQNADGQVLEPKLGVAFNVGRPAMADQGQSFRALVAVRGAFKFPGPGAYVVEASLPGADRKRAVFYAQHANAPVGLPPGFIPGTELPPM
jgi:hypothetical protein